MQEIDFIKRMFQELAGFVCRKHASRGQVGVTSKSEANDLLTEVDLAVQDRLVEAIGKEFPGDVIVAEERGLARIPDDPSVRCWVIDPIDGTQNFVRGIFPVFGISVAFAVDGRPVVGGVAVPGIALPGVATSQSVGVFFAEKGAGAYLNDSPIRVSSVDSVSLARVEVDFSGRSQRDETLARCAEILRRSGQIRCNCATVVALCSVAVGEMDAFAHVSLNPWDYAAGQIIVEEAGGRASRLDGSPLMLFENRHGVLISNGHVHDELVSLIPS